MGSRSGDQLPVGANVPTWAILLGAALVVLCLAFAAKASERPVVPAPEITPSASIS